MVKFTLINCQQAISSKVTQIHSRFWVQQIEQNEKHLKSPHTIKRDADITENLKGSGRPEVFDFRS